MDSKRRDHIGGVKLVGTPIPHRISQIIIKESTLTTLTKLNPVATKNMGVITAGLGLQTEEITKERKRRRNSKKKFHKDEQKQKDEGQHWE